MKKMIIIFALLGMSYQLLFSQGCDSTLKTDENNLFKYQKIKNRCEGFYRSQVVSASRIDVIGVTKGKFSYDLDSAEVIKISSPLVMSKNVTVRAQAIPIKTYYRMDAIITDGGTISWHIEDVLLPNRLTSNKIRILGWYESDGNKVYVPIRTQAKVNSIINDNSIYLTFRPTIKVINIQYSLYNYQAKESTGWQNPILSSCRSGMPINIRLVLDRGLYHLVISAQVEDSEDEWIEKQININSGVDEQ